MNWQYKGVDFIDPTGYFGFIYRITCIPTGKAYIGRKLFTKAKIKGITKTNKRKKKLRVANDWENYYGSSAELLEDIAKLGAENFHREIIHLTTKRGETNYLEALEILTSGALLSDMYYNKWVSLKLHKTSLAHLSSSSQLSSASAPAIPGASSE
jgi:hypothetical protein